MVQSSTVIHSTARGFTLPQERVLQNGLSSVTISDADIGQFVDSIYEFYWPLDSLFIMLPT
jgi:hypothetical protein